jgi:phosphoglycolate phosphatase-like HAD superfamily hydrolase
MGACNCRTLSESCSHRGTDNCESIICKRRQTVFSHAREEDIEEFRAGDPEDGACSDSEGSQAEGWNAESCDESYEEGWNAESCDESYDPFMQMRACLVVAVDIDDTLVLTVSAFKIWVDSKNGGPLFSRWSQYQREMQLASSEWRELAMKAGLFDDLPPVPGAKKGLEVLANAGIRLEAMTSRPESMRDVTMALLDKYFPKIFSDVHLTGGLEHKGDLCQRHGIHVLVDDSMEWLQGANERGVRCILFDFKGTYGSTKKPPMGIRRAESWEDVSRLIFPAHGILGA